MKNKIKVMLADDESLFIDLLSDTILDEKDIEVVGVASNGMEAEKIAIEKKPDVILMDIKMPLTNGIEATYKIKTLLPETKIIILSGQFKMEYINSIIRAGANGYILKSSNKDELLSAIKTAFYGGCVFDRDVIEPALGIKKKNQENEKKISIRELEVIQFCADGLINKEIAEKLSLSERTIHSHWRNIFSRLEVNTKLEAVVYCIKNNLINI